MRNVTLLLGIIAVGLIVVFGLTGDQERMQSAAPRTGQTFTVVELNACWLFDGIGEEQFPTAPQCEEDAESRLSDVADYLAPLAADVIVIEEIESAEMLHRLNEKLGNAYHEIFVEGTDDYTGQDVAALSRFPVLAAGRTDVTVSYPIPESRFRAPRGTQGVEKNVWATLAIGGQPITFIGLHLLAYPDDLERVVRREAQASIVRDLAAGFLAEGHEIVILGDINDFDAGTLDAAGNEPRSCVGTLLRDLDPDAEGDELVNAAARIDPADRYTYWYDENRNGIDDGDEEHSMIDHVYVSRALAESIVDVSIDHGGYDAFTVSDHWPVIVTFEMP